MEVNGEMSLLGLDASCIVRLFKPAEIGWLCDTSCVGRFADVAAGRRWSSTKASRFEPAYMSMRIPVVIDKVYCSTPVPSRRHLSVS